MATVADFNEKLQLLKKEVMALGVLANNARLLQAPLINKKCVAIQKLLADIEKTAL